MAAPDPFQQQQGKASIFDETREQNRVTKCILLFSQTTVKRTDREVAGGGGGSTMCDFHDFGLT